MIFVVRQTDIVYSIIAPQSYGCRPFYLPSFRLIGTNDTAQPLEISPVTTTVAFLNEIATMNGTLVSIDRYAPISVTCIHITVTTRV